MSNYIFIYLVIVTTTARKIKLTSLPIDYKPKQSLHKALNKQTNKQTNKYIKTSVDVSMSLL